MINDQRNDEPKIRTLWPNVCCECSSDAWVSDDGLVPSMENVGVVFIEKSAYDALQARCDELEERLAEAEKAKAGKVTCEDCGSQLLKF